MGEFHRQTGHLLVLLIGVTFTLEVEVLWSWSRVKAMKWELRWDGAVEWIFGKLNVGSGLFSWKACHLLILLTVKCSILYTVFRRKWDSVSGWAIH